MSEYWPEVIEGRIATKNRTGFMFTEINGASPAFIDDAEKSTGVVLDIGCAYGVVTLKVLQQSNCKVVAFDLSNEHLNILRLSVSEDNIGKLTSLEGRFPDDFRFESNSLDAIHSAYMFHFLSGVETEKGLTKCHQALKSGGKIYLNTMSVYFNIFKKFLTIYEANSMKGKRWPGEIHDFSQYLPEQDIGDTPDFFHVYKLEDFKAALLRSGFVIEQIYYYDLNEMPAWFASEGKGMIAAIASKS